MKPSIGRIVHYVCSDGSHAPAVITCVFSDTCVDLHVFSDDSSLSTITPTSVCMDETALQPFQWHWPEKV